MSETPRTRIAIDTFNDACDVPVSASAMVELERELAAANARIAELEKELHAEREARTG